MNSETTGDRYNIGAPQNIIDSAFVSEYRKDYAGAEAHNVWGVIKIFILTFGIVLGIPLIRFVCRDSSADAFWPYLRKVLIPALLIFLFIAAVYLRTSSSAMISDDSVVYGRLVPMMVNSLFGTDVIYSRTKAPDSAQFMRLNFFEHRPDEIKGSDLLSGVYKGVNFKCSYENAEYTEKDGEGDSYTYSTFCGIMLALPYRKTSGSMLGLRGRTEQEIKDRKGMRSFGRRIGKTENDEFNRLFYIMSYDDENLFYMLTPDVMEKLIMLYRSLDSFSKRLHVCFSEDTLYIGIPAKNFLRHRYVAPNEAALKKVQQKLWDNLMTVRSVLDMAVTL